MSNSADVISSINCRTLVSDVAIINNWMVCKKVLSLLYGRILVCFLWSSFMYGRMLVCFAYVALDGSRPSVICLRFGPIRENFSPSPSWECWKCMIETIDSKWMLASSCQRRLSFTMEALNNRSLVHSFCKPALSSSVLTLEMQTSPFKQCPDIGNDEGDAICSYFTWPHANC